MRAVISWVTPTTTFLMRQLIVASRLGRTEYQFLLMKISWWDRNVKIRYKCLVVIYEFWLVLIYQPNESIPRKKCVYSCYGLNVWLNVMQKLLIFLVVCDSALMRWWGVMVDVRSTWRCLHCLSLTLFQKVTGSLRTLCLHSFFSVS